MIQNIITGIVAIIFGFGSFTIGYCFGVKSERSKPKYIYHNGHKFRLNPISMKLDDEIDEMIKNEETKNKKDR